MAATVRILHLSDLHLSDPGSLGARILRSPKRTLAWMSWRRKKSKRHDPEILVAAAERIAQSEADAVAITGDLTNLGLPDEFAQAREFLPRFGSASRILFVPGNHDATASERWADTLGQVEPWLGEPLGENLFPRQLELSGVRLIGLSSARPSPPAFASGRIDASQLQALRTALARDEKAGAARIVLSHHPIPPGVVSWRKSLHGAEPLHQILADEGAELLLHGHAHRAETRIWSVGPRELLSSGAPSVSEYREDGTRGGFYFEYELMVDNEGMQGMRRFAHRWSPTTRSFERIEDPIEGSA